MKTRTSASALLAILALLCWGFESAALFAQSTILTTTELTNQADVVAVGKVASTKSEWNADRTRIFTRVTIAVRECLKGSATGQQLTLLTPGGEIGEVGEFYSGSVRFQQEEEVVVFAKGQADREMHLAGGAQGKITVTRDAATGMTTVGSGIRLDDFRLQVKSAIQAPSPERR